MAEAESNKLRRKEPQTVFVGAQLFLRVVAIAAALAGTVIMVTNVQTVHLGIFVIEARYNSAPEFEFLLIANIIASVFTALSSISLVVVGFRGSNPSYYFALFLHDLIMMSLLLSGCSAATAIGLLGKKGNDHTGWAAICNRLPKYCKRGTMSMALSYLALISLFILTLSSAVKSRQFRV